MMPYTSKEMIESIIQDGKYSIDDIAKMTGVCVKSIQRIARGDTSSGKLTLALMKVYIRIGHDQEVMDAQC